MSHESFLLTPELGDYVTAHSPQPDEVVRRLIQATASLGDIEAMRLSTAQASFLALMAKMVDARSVVEVGTFTGCSALYLARAVGPEGRVLCCDVSETYTDIAKTHWEEAGVADQIELVIAPAAETLASLPAEATIDLAFIDADKVGYVDYYELLVPRLRPGGLVVADNVLWYGSVVDKGDTSPDTEALRRFNDHASADPRTETVLLPVGDGFSVSRRLSD